MNNFEKQLNNLPKARLSRTADLKIRTKIYHLQWEKFAEKKNSFGVFNRRMAFASVSVFLLAIVILVPAYAYASPGVVQGNVLYPLKLLVEKAELAVPKSKEAEATVYEKNANRRLAEAEILSEKTGGHSAEYLVETVNSALELKSKASAIIRSLNDDAKDLRISEKINQTQKEQEELIKQVAQNVGLGAEDSVLNSVSSMISAVTENNGKGDEGVDRKTVTPNQKPSKVRHERREVKGKIKATTSEIVIVPLDGDRLNANLGTRTPSGLNVEKNSIDEMVEKIKEENFYGPGAEKLRAKLEIRSKKASQALTEGNQEKAEKLIGESRQLLKNAKYFIKADQEGSEAGDRKRLEIEKLEREQGGAPEGLRASGTEEAEIDKVKALEVKYRKNKQQDKEER